MRKSRENNKILFSQGVSVAELSIVIAVIGLLAGIISGGVKLKKASELRGIITDVEAFRVAIEGFDVKYSDLPGDMSDAHTYWDDGGDGVCGDITECNGNSDGLIDRNESANVDDKEHFRAWQHLNLAAFIEGGYNGVASGTGTSNQAVPGINVPRTSRTKGGFMLMTWQSSDSGVQVSIPAGTYIIAGSFDDNKSSWLDDPLLTPSEAFSIDQKTDDGLPDTGKTRGRFGKTGESTWLTTKCLSGTYPKRTYNKTNTDIECLLYFTIN